MKVVLQAWINVFHMTNFRLERRKHIFKLLLLRNLCLDLEPTASVALDIIHLMVLL
jgi:hypothetical protein